MATKCFIPILGKRLRVTVLDSCGVPAAAGTEDAWLATSGFITVTLSAEVEDGTEIIQRRADGSLCVNEQGASSFKRFTVEMEFCGVNPSLLAMTTNAEPYLDYADDIAGFTVPEGPIDKKFALELWTGLSGQACAPGAEEAGGYLLLPYVQAGVLGDIAIDGENAVTFSLTGAYTKGGNGWGVGPYDVVLDDTTPAALPTELDPLDHLLLIDTGLAPPPEACDPQSMAPFITSLSPATGPLAGATVVTVTGAGFTGATAVQFDGVAGTSFSVVDDDTITVTTPAGTVGTADVTVVNATAGNVTETAGYTYT